MGWILPTAHPRIRGERWVIRRSVISHPGSSPHTRETPPCQRDQGCFCRFIPACAGNARARFTKARSWPVHPRIRGERAVGARVVEPVAGLSPHTRGTPLHRLYGAPVRRFIPAYAGNESLISARASCTTVHPRIRGERGTARITSARPSGSSPHTRGTHVLHAVGDLDHRFIPAYAGNAPSRLARDLSHPVHPRIRGERTGGQTALPSIIGSSPHTRGTQLLQVVAHRLDRFIPAYAGNALPVSY